MRGVGLAAAAALALATHPAAAASGYALYTQWADTTYDLATCKQHAESALRKSRFTSDVTITENAVYGRRAGGYTAGVRCLASKNIVFFVISGPTGSVASKYLDVIVKNY